MEQAFVELVLFRIKEKYRLEKEFYESIHLSEEEWEKWKQGEQFLEKIEVAAIRHLFSDYEWMLVQKVLQQTQIIPEKSNTAFHEYQKMSVTIAKKWLQSDLATVELVEKLNMDNKLAKNIEVRVMMNYGSWGYNDILSFTFPAIDRDKVASSKRELIQLIDQTYVTHGG